MHRRTTVLIPQMKKSRQARLEAPSSNTKRQAKKRLQLFSNKPTQTGYPYNDHWAINGS